MSEDIASLQRELQYARYDLSLATDSLARSHEEADELRLARETDQAERLREFNELQRQITVLRRQRDALRKGLEDLVAESLTDERNGQ